MSLQNLCRLCSTTGENLIWVFDKRFQFRGRETMKNVIMITTDVEIQPTDTISQKICEKCCKITVKMYEFRKQAIANDKRLKELWAKHMEQLGVIIPKAEFPTLEPPEIQKPTPIKTAIEIHPSVKDIFQQYPTIKLPSICLNADVAPCVTMPIDYVEDYFKSRNLNFHVMSTLALSTSLKKVARKRTAPPGSPYRCPINAEIIPDGYASDDNDNLVRPIKLKIISNINLNVTDDIIVCDKPPPKDPEIQETHRKRKLSEVTEIPEVAVKKPALLEPLEPTTNETSNNLSYVANVSVPLHICNMCSAVCYHAKDLKKHQSKHLRCQFCKEKFKCLEKKEEHLESQCWVKNMNSLPDLEIERIEFNPDIRRKYPEAFVDFPPLEDIETSEDLNNKDITDECEVIEILSDSSDEEEPINIDALPKRHISQIVHTKENLPRIQAIKPDISIKNSTIFKELDPKSNDSKMLKELLAKVEPLKRRADKGVWTKLSIHSAIKINGSTSTAEFKSLKQHLHSYKIPIIIKPGDFSASFRYRSEPQPERKLCLWNDLTPVDIKPTNAEPDPNTHESLSTPSVVPNEPPEAPSDTSPIECPAVTVDKPPDLLNSPQLLPSEVVTVAENSNNETPCANVSNPMDSVSEICHVSEPQPTETTNFDVEPSSEQDADYNQNSIANTTDIVTTDSSAVSSINSVNYAHSDTTQPVSASSSDIVAEDLTQISSSDVLATSEPSGIVDLSFRKTVENVLPPLPTFTTRSNYTISQSTSTTICADAVKFAPSSSRVQSAPVSNSILNYDSNMTSVAALPPPYSHPPPPYPSSYQYAPPRALYPNNRRNSQNATTAVSSNLRAVRLPRANSVPSTRPSSSHSQLNSFTSPAPSNFRNLPHFERFSTGHVMTEAIKAAFEKDKFPNQLSTATCSAGLERLFNEVLTSSTAVSINSFTASKPTDVISQTQLVQAYLQGANTSFSVVSTRSMSADTTPTSNHTSSPHRRDLSQAEANTTYSAQLRLIKEQLMRRMSTGDVFLPSSAASNNSFTVSNRSDVTNKTRQDESHFQSANNSVITNSCRNVVSTPSMSANTTPTSNITSPQMKNSVNQAESCSAAVTQNVASIPNAIVPPFTTSNAMGPHLGNIRIKSMWELT